MENRSYEVSSVRAITEDLQTEPFLHRIQCECDCHRLWGLDGTHIAPCCDWMIETNGK